MKTIFKITFLIFAISSLFVSELSAKKKEEAKVDHMALATLMIQDANYQRARLSLDEVDKSVENFDFKYYFTLRGMVSMKLNEYKTAIEELNQAIDYGQNDKSVFLYLIEANYKLKNYSGTIEAIQKAGEFGKDNAQLFTIKAESYWKLKNPNSALNAIAEGYKLFPENHNFLKQKFFYLVNLHLYQSAIETASYFLDKSTPTADTILAMASSLKNAGDYDRAIQLLEEGQLMYPANPKLSALLSHLYIKIDRSYTSATIMERASVFERKYKADSSEIYRRAGAFSQALYLNSQILDRQEKLKQRLSIYLQFSHFDKAVAMEGSMKRSGLLKKNEDIRYALAYALYMTGDFISCERHLKKLQRGDLFAKAVELRKNIQKCQEDKWSCP
jgi:tetratricopeptide (TPR) repeat protein